MKRTVVLRPEARAELRDARRWYEERVEGLGLRFSQALEAALHMIAGHPEAFRKVYGEIRQCVLPRFPYSVLCRLSDDAVVVVAIFHQRQDPETWREGCAS